VSFGLDPMPELPQGRPPLPPDVHDALVAMWAEVFVERARAEATKTAAYQAWIRRAE
jgi:hypothetical protein